MLDLQNAVGFWVLIYFIPVIFVGSFFLMNLTLAVISSKFNEEMENTENKKIKKKKKQAFQRKGVDDSDHDDDLSEIAKSKVDEVTLKKLKIEAMTLQEIEDCKDLIPDEKKMIKDKRRLEELIKKMGVALKQREDKYKTTTCENSKSQTITRTALHKIDTERTSNNDMKISD